MVYWPTIQYIYTAGIIFVLFFILAPFLYTFWFDTLRSMVNTTTPLGLKLQAAGDLLFRYFEILGYLIPGLVIGWGFAAAARTGTQEQGQTYYEG